MKKLLFILLDGIGDGLKQSTSLSQANIPNLNLFAKQGFAGLINNNLSEHPDSGLSTFSLLGCPIEEYPGRGILDALGAQIKIKSNSIYLRANFATVKQRLKQTSISKFENQLIIKDRRAGREEKYLNELSNSIKSFNFDKIKTRFYHTLGHRGILELSNHDLSSNLSDSDKGEINEIIEKIRPLDRSSASAKTSAALNKFEIESHKILSAHPLNKKRNYPANFILLRGASKAKTPEQFKEKFGLNGVCIGVSPIVKGIFKYLGMSVEKTNGTGNTKTNLSEKLSLSLLALKKYNFVFLHILGADVAGHDKNKFEKIRFIEQIDKQIIGNLKNLDFSKITLVVTSDHITSISTGKHEKGMFPFLIYTKPLNSEVPNGSKASMGTANEVHGHVKNASEASGLNFSEKSCKLGPVIQIENFMEMLMKFI